MSEATTQDASDSAMSGMHDFDFLFGHWTIMNRRLKERLKACSEWEQFEAKYECEPIWARFIWTKIDPNKTRWQQAFSPDYGQTWETNWVMGFTKGSVVP
ncbi:hypothetical protein MJD09_24765 [bacterium]|nr:hypothetical protein [bacterium]